MAASFSTSLNVLNVRAYGAIGNGSTNDTAAIQSAINAANAQGGGTIFFPRGIYQLTSSPTTVNGCSAQLHLPSIDLDGDSGIGLRFLGEHPQTMTPSVVGGIVVPTGGSILRSTATSGAVIGGRFSSGGAYDFTIVNAHFESLAIRVPSNAACSAIDMGYVAACSLRNVVIDCGVYDMDSVTEPTTSTSYGIVLPRISNGAYTRVDSVMVLGMYTGVRLGEHCEINSLSVQGCFYGIEVGNEHHGMHIARLLDQHCRYGIRCTASSTPHPRLDIAQYGVERVVSGSQGGAPNWQLRQNDVVDASNLLYGTCRYAEVTANVGPANNFSKSGGSNFVCTNIGSA